MRRLTLALFLVSAAGCSGTTVDTTSSSTGGFGGFGGFGGLGAAGTTAGSASGSTTGHAIGGSTGSASGGSHGSVSGSSGFVNPTTIGTTLGNTGSTGATLGATSSSGATLGTTGSTGATISGTGTTTGSSCVTLGDYAGIGATDCCPGLMVSSAGYCEPPGTSSTSATNGTGSTTGTTTGGTGTTTGGTCPENLPNLATGQTTTVAGTCTGNGDSTCPTGFSCINHECILHGSSGPLQITMSWDDPEDLDLHVVEPEASGVPCEIWYGNVGNREYVDGGMDPDSSTGVCTPIGWLDRDSNPACSFDNVDIENVIYPYSGNPPPPSGTYTVRADFWEDCTGQTDDLDGGAGFTVPEYSEIPYAIQVRVNGAVYKYCQSFTGGTADNGSLGSGTVVTTFTYP